jgi:hypothetical protein
MNSMVDSPSDQYDGGRTRRHLVQALPALVILLREVAFSFRRFIRYVRPVPETEWRKQLRHVSAMFRSSRVAAGIRQHSRENCSVTCRASWCHAS